jgi:hypothetical protein
LTETVEPLETLIQNVFFIKLSPFQNLGKKQLNSFKGQNHSALKRHAITGNGDYLTIGSIAPQTKQLHTSSSSKEPNINSSSVLYHYTLLIVHVKGFS